MNDRLAKFLFQRRNAVFPLVFALLLVVFRPTPLDDLRSVALLALGLMAVAAGQGLRVLTIGLKYIKRGGKKGRFYASDLVTDGIFAHCRNPLYVGNILIGVGFLLIAGNMYTIVIGTAMVLWVYALIVGGEERYLAGRFGEAYRAYCMDVPRWTFRLPNLGRTLSAARFDWVRLINKEYGTLYTSALIPLGLIGWKLYRTGGSEALRPQLPVLIIAFVVATVAYAAARIMKKTGRLESAVDDPSTRSDPLTDARDRIDRVDAELLRLFNERGAIVLNIFKYKSEQGITRFDKARTEVIIRRTVDRNAGPLTDEQVERLFRFVLEQNLHVDDVGAPGEDETAASARPAPEEVSHVG